MNTNDYKTWEQYIAEDPGIEENHEKEMAAKIQSYDEMMFRFIMFLLM